MKNLLFVQPYASQVGGVDSVLLQLIEGLDRKRYRSFVLLTEPTPYASKYETLGATVLYGPLAVFGKPTDAGYYFRNLYKLAQSLRHIRRLAKEHRIDLIHSHKMEAIGANIIGKALGIPTVQTVHELPRKPLVAYKFVAYLNHLFNDKVIVLCERSKIMFRWFSGESAKLTKIYNGIADQSEGGDLRPIGFDLGRELGLAPDDRLAITVARLSPMKGLEYLIEAAALLKEESPEIKFVIVGDVAFAHEAPYKEKLARSIRDAGLEGQVFMLGLRRDVPSLLAQCDALVVPSVYDIFPTVILEAMSSGLPVVATDVGGIPEMVRQGTGLLTVPESGEALKEALEQLFSADYKAMGTAGRAVFLREFTREKYVSRTAELYEELFRARAAQRSS
ncbi:glycosyltransferase family 4 protein [Cohnella soli]|uniref:Glycosyltransferase family 4 protein n=1 Tax=Cohnella soli TaxID=425005 RepID=A0ABW0HXE1_9BACL